MSSTKQGTKQRQPSCDDDAPSCWICLEEGPDKSGKHLVRDCSCRGDQGLAHLSCLLEYAKQKCLDSDPTNFTAPYETCPFCLQFYQHELALELGSSLVKVVDESNKGKGDSFIGLLRRFEAQRVVANAIKTLFMRDQSSEMIDEGIKMRRRLCH